MTYAIFRSGGKQFRAEPGKTLRIPSLKGEAGEEACGVWLRQPIPAAHKVALHAIPAGAVIRRYGYPIGIASRAIAAGEHVHSHNLVVGGQAAGQPAPSRDAAGPPEGPSVRPTPSGEPRAPSGGGSSPE